MRKLRLEKAGNLDSVTSLLGRFSKDEKGMSL
jgi:hypothetical protein